MSLLKRGVTSLQELARISELWRRKEPGITVIDKVEEVSCIVKLETLCKKVTWDRLLIFIALTLLLTMDCDPRVSSSTMRVFMWT